MRAVTLPAAVAAAIAAHARRDRPYECCGLLLGSASVIADAVPARNLASPPETRYLIDPLDHFAALRVARSRGLEVVGAYHSHLRSPAQPSPTDLAEAFGGFLFLIISLARPEPAEPAAPAEPAEPELLAWELEHGNFVPVSLVRTA